MELFKNLINVLMDNPERARYKRGTFAKPSVRIPHSIRLLVAVALALGTASVQAGIDVASNAPYTPTWDSGDNGGSGFGAWVLSGSGGTGGFGGAELKDPTAVSITGMGTTAFTLYADPGGSGAFSNADRAFSSPLNIGDTFSIQLGINFDSGATGSKGFNVYSGGVGGTQLVNINNFGSAAITINGNPMFANYGTNAMTLNFQLTTATNLHVFGNGRDGSESYSGNFTVAAAPDAFRLYASNLQTGDIAKPYLNTLQIVPEPSTLLLITLGSLLTIGRLRARARR